MVVILRFAALVLFIIAAVIAFLVDAPDAIDILGFIAAGLAAWVGSTLVPATLNP